MVSKRTNGVLVVLMILGFFASLSVALERWRVESGNERVQLVLDYDEAREFTSSTGYPLDEFLLKMKEAGVTSIALHESRVSDLVQDGRALFVSNMPNGNGGNTAGEALSDAISETLSGIPPSDRGSVLVLPNADWVVGFVRDLSSRLVGFDVKSIVSGEGEDSRIIVHTAARPDKLLRQRIGMDRNRVASLRNLGFTIVPRYGNFRGNNPAGIGTMLGQLEWMGGSGIVIFDGRDALGYRKNLDVTADYMRKAGFYQGLVEMSKQQGEETIAKRLGYQSLRVHSVSSGEMRVLKPRVIIDRYVRAVRERGMRVLYLRPIPERADPIRLVSVNRALVTDLVSDLRGAGYSMGDARPYRRLTTPLWVLAVVSTGVLAASSLLAWRILNASVAVRIGIVALGLLAFIAFVSTGRGILGRQAFALLAASVVPALAILAPLNNRVLDKEATLAGTVKDSFWLLARTSAISAVGGLFVVGLLGDTVFILKLSQFIGVKLMHVLPIVLVAVALGGIRDRLRSPGTLWGYMVAQYNSSIAVKYLVWGAVAALLGLVYISRTGNETSIPVTEFERGFRNLLERVLIARPRTKEFLFAHPITMLGFALYLGGFKRWAAPCLVLGVIGQASIVNTHTHIHSPLLITTLRWVYGVIMGGVAGWVLIWAVDAAMRVYLRLPKGIRLAPAGKGAPSRRVRGARR